ncbi:MAG: DUF5615 family PIN-like protein [Proteobacteria bacterium]|nr:DUF5615 family PIN-like protein [Pseudomonadota bacterium]
MNFLLDANMPRAALSALVTHGHGAQLARDIGLGTAPDEQIAQLARAHAAVLVTRDLDFADVRRYPPGRHFGLLVLRLPDTATAMQIAGVLDRFLKSPRLVAHLPGRLAVVDPVRVRFRPPLENP